MSASLNGLIVICETGVYHVPVAFQCIYGCNDEGCENGDGGEGSEISGGTKRVDIACMQMTLFYVESHRKT